MSAHFLLNLLNELQKRDKMRGSNVYKVKTMCHPMSKMKLEFALQIIIQILTDFKYI